ncbi:hypothetical protein C8R43DRAFT_948510 [Mycena crocata]|nr:hypothetical protein C8R43DRAFT_948510 [Mycena crocata]
MSDDEYSYSHRSSSPFQEESCQSFSQQNYYTHKENHREHRKQRLTGAAPYSRSATRSPAVLDIKSESVSPTRPLRLSAIQANQQFGSNEQYGAFLDSQVGDLSYVETLYKAAEEENKPASDEAGFHRPCLQCFEMIAERKKAIDDCDEIMAAWRKAQQDLEDAQHKCEEAQYTCNKLQQERDEAVMECRRWRKAAVGARDLIALAAEKTSADVEQIKN